MSKKQILLVDDEEVIQNLCRRLMNKPSFELVVVGSVEEARSELNKSLPDLLITDLKLPDGNGVDIIEYARKLSDDMKIIIITGSPNPESNLYNMPDAKIYKFISKPFELEILKESVDGALDE